jgi:hypothetical protein
MALKDDARVTIIIADYIGIDGGGKLNVVGGGWTIAGIQPNGLSAPQYVAVMIDVASGHLGEEFALDLELHDLSTGEIAQVVGATNTPEALRISQLCRVDPPGGPGGVYVPADMFSRVQAVFGFHGGIPLAVGRKYAWRVAIDGERRPGWAAEFLVAGPPPQPVFGGPAGPSSIPTLPS